jgi:hypothetical protein
MWLMTVDEPALDFDAYWRAWLASRLAEMRERAIKMRNQIEAQTEDQEY